MKSEARPPRDGGFRTTRRKNEKKKEEKEKQGKIPGGEALL